VMDLPARANVYLEHLSDGDLTFLRQVLEDSTGEHVSMEALVRSPDRIESALEDPRLSQRLFEGAENGDVLVHVSLFLVFAAMIHRTAADLSDAVSVSEWLGPHERLPVFDVEGLRSFLAAPERRLFLAELLASYTRVLSGAVRYRAHDRWVRRRVSELDLMGMIELTMLLPEAERPWLYRRLGDLALFLSGVFPDHVATHPPFSTVDARRLMAVFGDEQGEPVEGVVPFLEQLGRRWYRHALRTSPVITASLRVLADVAREIQPARRVLNVVTERYILPTRGRWFPLPGSH
jgi:hypothetical protein